jgi:alpha,alpha-trehalase
LVSPEQAQRLVAHALPRLEAPGGLLASAPESLSKIAKPNILRRDGAKLVRQVPSRQWEAPSGWAPHQMLAWVGLQQHGFTEDAQRLAYRWLLLIAENAANFHGTVPEKFDVMARSHRVFAEYGNVGTEFSYIATEGFGWMNASFLVGLDVLTPEQHAFLTALRPTESVF